MTTSAAKTEVPAVPRSIATHERRADIDASLDAGLSLRVIQAQFAVDKSTLSRYARARSDARVAELESLPSRETVDILQVPRKAFPTVWSRCAWTETDDIVGLNNCLYALGERLNSSSGVLDTLGEPTFAAVVSNIRRRRPGFALEGSGRLLKPRFRLSFDIGQARWASAHPGEDDDLELQLRKIADPAVRPWFETPTDGDDD